ncbi:MAG: hypothetical protein WC314_03460 [Vulcanimicrobiota bacterium]
MSLAELLLAASLFGVFLTGVFLLFGRGNQALKRMDEAGGMQAEMLRVKLLLRRDFIPTDLGAVTIQKSNPTSDARDQITCLAMSDWSEEGNFSGPNNAPQWNRRVAYLSTSEKVGQLERVVLEPEPPALLPRPLTSWLPLAQDQIVVANVLSKNLKEFEANIDLARQELQFQVSFVHKDGPRINGSFHFSPLNTRSRL